MDATNLSPISIVTVKGQNFFCNNPQGWNDYYDAKEQEVIRTLATNEYGIPTIKECKAQKQSGGDQFKYSIWEGHVLKASRPPL